MKQLNQVTEITTSSQPQYYTKLKFYWSEVSSRYVAYVHQDRKGKFWGVEPKDARAKKICLTHHKIETPVLPGVLYNAIITPMYNKNGFVIVSLTEVAIPARIEVKYIPNIIYELRVSFGNRTLKFDPLYGRNDSMRTVNGFLDLVKSHPNIKNISNVVGECCQKANAIMNKFIEDGAYIRNIKQYSKAN